MAALITEPGARALVVEDEFLVSLGITSLLEELGFEVVGPAARLDEAERLAFHERLTVAVLDVNLAGEMSWPVARILKTRNVPAFFLSGYHRSVLAIPEEVQDLPFCLKPVDEERVTQVIRMLLGR